MSAIIRKKLSFWMFGKKSHQIAIDIAFVKCEIIMNRNHKIIY